VKVGRIVNLVLLALLVVFFASNYRLIYNKWYEIKVLKQFVNAQKKLISELEMRLAIAEAERYVLGRGARLQVRGLVHPSNYAHVAGQIGLAAENEHTLEGARTAMTDLLQSTAGDLIMGDSGEIQAKQRAALEETQLWNTLYPAYTIQVVGKRNTSMSSSPTPTLD